MNKLIILAVSLVASSTFASEAMEESVIQQTDTDASFLIKNPVHPGGANLPFSIDYWTQEIGVCKALGFATVAAKSSRFSEFAVDAIQIDPNGKVIGGEKKSVITQIICLNKTGVVSSEKTTLIMNPKHPESSLPLSIDYWSQEVGVCKALGFASVAAKSSRFSESPADAIQVDANGKVIGGEKKTTVTRIVCINS